MEPAWLCRVVQAVSCCLMSCIMVPEFSCLDVRPQRTLHAPLKHLRWALPLHGRHCDWTMCHKASLGLPRLENAGENLTCYADFPGPEVFQSRFSVCSVQKHRNTSECPHHMTNAGCRSKHYSMAIWKNSSRQLAVATHDMRSVRHKEDCLAAAFF